MRWTSAGSAALQAVRVSGVAPQVAGQPCPLPLARKRTGVGGQYFAGGRVTVTDDPRLSVRVMLHELRSPHGSLT
jgi:hypothetical protein